MRSQKNEYTIVFNAVNILSLMCSKERDEIIDILTGYLWNKEEASMIKESDGKIYTEQER